MGPLKPVGDYIDALVHPAALSASRRVVTFASAFALASAGLLVLLGMQGLLPAAGQEVSDLTALGIVSAALFATGLALGACALVRNSTGLLDVEEERYRLLVRNMTDVVTRHGRGGSVLFVSPAAARLFGGSPNDLHGHGLFDRVHVADRPAYLTALGDAAACGEARSVEFRVRREPAANGGHGSVPQFVWIEMRCRPLEGEAIVAADAHPQVVAVMRDVTERKLQQHALVEARAQAERANDAKSRFLATMTHELRTPLTAIIGFSEMLANEEGMRLDAARRQDYSRLINDSGVHLLSVVNGVLDVSKIETGDLDINPEPFAPSQAVRNCCDLLALKARDSGIDLSVRVHDGLPQLVADKRAFRQIVINLVSNALKFTDRGGRVTVGAKIDGTVLAITVQDTGVGIGPEDLARVGQPFFQARASYDRSFDGTGLGLSIVQGLVMLHGGHIDIASHVGEGTCVTVRLPIDCQGAQPMRVRQSEKISHPTFERVIEAGRDLEKKRA